MTGEWNTRTVARGGGFSDSARADTTITARTTPFRYSPGHASTYPCHDTVHGDYALAVPAFPFILSGPWETAGCEPSVIRFPYQHEGSSIGSSG